MTMLLGVASFSIAQQPGRGFSNPEESAKRTAERLEKELKLTAAQKDSVYAYSLAQSKAMQQAFQGNKDGDREQLGKKMRELRTQTDEKILSVLDSDQKKAYNKLIEGRANRMRAAGNRRGGGNR